MTKKISFVINTAAGDPALASRLDQDGRCYSERAAFMEDVLDAACSEADEVIVVGQFHEGEGYSYYFHPPVFRRRLDALYYRDYGFALSTGDIVVFSHDDHVVGEGFREVLLSAPPFDILVPRREDSEGNELNNGRNEGYMGGHVAAFRREVLARVPWTAVETTWWDLSLSRLWKEKGFEITYSDDLVHIAL